MQILKTQTPTPVENSGSAAAADAETGFSHPHTEPEPHHLHHSSSAAKHHNPAAADYYTDDDHDQSGFDQHQNCTPQDPNTHLLPHQTRIHSPDFDHSSLGSAKATTKFRPHHPPPPPAPAQSLPLPLGTKTHLQFPQPRSIQPGWSQGGRTGTLKWAGQGHGGGAGLAG